MMKSQLSAPNGEQDHGQSSKAPPLPHCWWRSATEFRNDDLDLDVLNVASLTPRLRVLRELERLASVADKGISEARYQLPKYRPGGFWVPTGGVGREGMDIPPMITLLLVGFSGSGKSSLVNLMYSVLGRSGCVHFARTSSGSDPRQTTVYLEEHNVMRTNETGFCVYDSRGFEYEKVEEAMEDVSSWMGRGVRHNQLCLRKGDGGEFIRDEAESARSTSSSKFVLRSVNCVMVVVNLAEVYGALKSGDLKPLEATKALFCLSLLRKCDENPILILTHGDLLTPEERIEGRLQICIYLGISETNGVYDIVCLTEFGLLADPITSCALAEAVYRALVISDRTHLPKNNLLDSSLSVISRLMFFLALGFGFLADLCSNLGKRGRLKMNL